MARGQNRPASTTTTENETPEGTVTTTTASEPSTEAPAAPQTDPQPETTESGEQGTATPAPQEPAEAKAAETVDLGPWNEAVAQALETADKTTGTVPEANVSAVVAAYRALSTKGRAEAKKAVQGHLRTQVQDRQIAKAQAVMALSDAMTEGTASKTTREHREPVDPTKAFVDRAVMLALARTIFTGTVPQGVKDDWKDQANKEVTNLQPQVEVYAEYLKARAEHTGEGDGPEEPEGVSPVVKGAFKLAQGKSAGLPKVRVANEGGSKAPFEGPTRSIVKHIQEAFEDLPSGAFLKVNEIRKHRSREYGDDLPSSGAVSSRLKSKNAIEGITSGEKDGHQGAYKN